MRALNLVFILFSTSFFASYGQNADAEKKAKEVRKEIDNMDNKLEHGTIGNQCNEDLEEYTKYVDLLLALSKERAQKGDSEEIKSKMEETDKKLETLSKKMKEHLHVYMQGDCAVAWANAQQKYAQYVQQNIQDFMPKD